MKSKALITKLKEQIVDLAESMVLYNLPPTAFMWVEQPNGDFAFSEEAQDLFNSYVDELGGLVFEKED